MQKIKNKIYTLLRWSEKYTKTDMIYLSKGGFWLTFGQIIASGSALLLSIAFANLLPKESYGNYRYILSLFSIFIIFSLSGTNTSIIQAVANGFEGSFWKIFKTKIKWSLLGSLISISTAIYYILQKNYNLGYALIIIAVCLPFFESSNLYQSLLHGRKNFKMATILVNYTSIISLLIMLCTLLITDNILLVLISYLGSQISLQLLFTWLTLKKNPLNQKSDGTALTFGIHLSLMDIFKTVAGQIDKILIFHYLGAGNLALYAFIIAPISHSKSFILNLKSLALPKLSQSNTQEVIKHLPEKIRRLEFIVLLFIILYIILAPILFKILFPQYIEAVPYSQIYAITLLFLPRSLLSTLMVAKVKQKELYSIRFLAPLWKIIILFIALKYWGLWGMVFGTILSELGQYFLYNYFYKRAFYNEKTNQSL